MEPNPHAPTDWPRQPAHGRRSAWFLAAALLISALANGALLWAVQSSFARLHAARIFPLGYVGPASAPPHSAAGSGPVIAFWGDSRAALWDKAALGQRYVVVDRAHGSITSAQLSLDLWAAPPAAAQVAVLQVGINDLHPLGALTPAQARAAVDQLHANVGRIVARLRMQAEQVVLTTVIPPGPVPLVRRTVWYAETRAEVERLNQVLRAMADGDRVLVLDAHALLRNADGWLDERYADGDFFLHVNALAYAHLNAALVELLERHPRPPRS